MEQTVAPSRIARGTLRLLAFLLGRRSFTFWAAAGGHHEKHITMAASLAALDILVFTRQLRRFFLPVTLGLSTRGRAGVQEGDI